MTLLFCLIARNLLKIHNYIYANEGLSNSETLNEFLKIFYCKIIDEKNNNLLSTKNSDEDIILRMHKLFDVLKEKLGTFIDSKEKMTVFQKNDTLHEIKILE